MHDDILNATTESIAKIPSTRIEGRIAAVEGGLARLESLSPFLSLGSQVRIGDVLCEVVALSNHEALAMPFGSLQGVGMGAIATPLSKRPEIFPNEQWLGRVIDAFAAPLDGMPMPPKGEHAMPIYNTPPPANERRRLGGKLALGVRVLDCFLTCCRGQRLGLFAGSGVGKSTLLSMIARFCAADIVVMALIGERGREVREFIELDLGTEGLARSVVVVSTSDEPALKRRMAARTAMAVAEYFRDQGRQVLFLMDSVTRFATAQREIGLAAGEPAATRGYTPSVFAELPKLLERAGPGHENLGHENPKNEALGREASGRKILGHGGAEGATLINKTNQGQPASGDITAIFTVLVEGDDFNEPVSDTTRSILDGHIVLERDIAHRGRYPPVDVLKSVSRALPRCNTSEENALIDRARALMAEHDRMAELIRLGAYRRGTDARVDEAIFYNEPLEQFCAQAADVRAEADENYAQLQALLDKTQPSATPSAAPPKETASKPTAGLMPSAPFLSET